MQINKNGSVCFYKKDGVVFIFRKDNYNRHCQKHERLKDKLHLKELEKTLCDPDVITKGPNKNKKTYYRVFKHEYVKHNIWVRVIKIPVFQDRKNKKVYFIATTFDIFGFNWEIIHPIEKIIWQKSTSLI